MLSALAQRTRRRWDKSLTLIVAVVGLLVLFPMAGCDTVPTSNAVATPTLATRTQPSPTRPQLLIQYCDDDTGSYNRPLFFQANTVIADSLQSAVTANQEGVTLYATAITHNTFDPSNTLNPAIQIPAIPAYPTPPTPVPTKAPDNPVFDNATATAVQAQTLGQITAYNQGVVQIDATIQTAKTGVQQDITRLTKWKPPIDAIGTSVLGCFQLAATRFQGQTGVKMLYIASDLENNSDVDFTQNFVKERSLNGAIVHVIFFYSRNAGRDQEKRAQWCPYLKSAGASAVIFSEPVTPLPDMFDNDLKNSVSAC
jgi:hypothetical protein